LRLGLFRLNVHLASIIPLLVMLVLRENVVTLVPHVQFKLTVHQKLTSDVNVILDTSVMPILVDVLLSLSAPILHNVVQTNSGIFVEALAVKSNVLEVQ
jgi:hypothetical protein